MALTRFFLCSRQWQFGRSDGSIIANKIQFRRDGTIVGYHHPNEARWHLEMGILVFSRLDGVATTRFAIKRLSPAPASLRGTFLFDENITHILTEVGRVPMPNREDFRDRMYAATEQLRMIPVWPSLGYPLLVEWEQLLDFKILVAGISQGTPPKTDLLRVLQTGYPEMQFDLVPSSSTHPGIYGPLEPPLAPFMLKTKEIIRISAYPSSARHDPPRSSREHQYHAGFRWEATVALGVSPPDLERIKTLGAPRMFDIEWRCRGTGGTLYHCIYVSDIHRKSELSFLHVTDTHVAARNDVIPEVLAETRNRHEARRLRLRYNNFNDNLRATIRFANQKKIDFVVITGDLVDYFHDGVFEPGHPSWYQDYQAGVPGEFGGWLGNPAQEDSNFIKVVDILTGRDGRGEMLQCPVFCIPGNHDYLRMEPPLVVNAKIKLSLITVKEKLGMKPEAFGLNLQEAGEFEFWKRTRGDSLPARRQRIISGKGFDPVEYNGDQFLKFGRPQYQDIHQYLLTIGYHTDFFVAIGPHRLICLNTGEDVGVPEAGNLSDPDSWTLSIEQKHYIDDQSHNRGIIPSHLDLIKAAVLEASNSRGLCFVCFHAPLVRERKPGDDWPGDTSTFEGWGPGRLPDDKGSYSKATMRQRNMIPGLDGCTALWGKQCPGHMVEWIENGAGGVDVALCGHSHDIKEYRLNNGAQVSTGEYAAALTSCADHQTWLNEHRPLQFISGRLKGPDREFRQVTIRDRKIQSLAMSNTARYDQQDSLRLGFLFTALSIDLARFGGYSNPARNDLNPAAHLGWSRAVNHRLMVMWDLMEKYELQFANIAYLQEFAGRPAASMTDHLRRKLNQANAAIANAIPIYRRIAGGLHPSADYWIDKQGLQRVLWRVRVFYALCAASLNIFGVDFGSPAKNSLDLADLYRWADYPKKNQTRLMDALEERIGKLVEFAHAGSNHLLAMWFAAESVHLAPWASWNENPVRGSRDPAVHLRWALGKNRDAIVNDLSDKYATAAHYQYRHLQQNGLKQFYVYHSVRMAAWGGSVGTLNEQPDHNFFEAEATRLYALAPSEQAWVNLIIKDIKQRVKGIGIPLAID